MCSFKYNKPLIVFPISFGTSLSSEDPVFALLVVNVWLCPRGEDIVTAHIYIILFSFYYNIFHMPYTRRPHYRRKFQGRNRRWGGRRVGAHLGYAPRWHRKQRVNQGLTRNVFWFKTTGGIVSAPGGLIFQRFAPNQVTLNNQFTRYAYLYEQFKVIKMIVKFFPANVGAEQLSLAPAVLPPFQRGNICTYVDQPPIAVAPPANINDVLSLPSCRLAQPRRFIKRWINRPRGGRFLDWTLIDHVTPGGAPAFNPESWTSEVRLYGDNFTPSSSPHDFFFYEQLFKVVFRSRYHV